MAYFRFIIVPTSQLFTGFKESPGVPLLLQTLNSSHCHTVTFYSRSPCFGFVPQPPTQHCTSCVSSGLTRGDQGGRWREGTSRGPSSCRGLGAPGPGRSGRSAEPLGSCRNHAGPLRRGSQISYLFVSSRGSLLQYVFYCPSTFSYFIESLRASIHW